MINRKMAEGDALAVDDRTGFTVRQSEMVTEWTGLRVHHSREEPRHPQEFVHGVSDHMNVEHARPPGVDQFVGPLIMTTTLEAAAGATSLTVVATTRAQAGDRLGVTLRTGEIFYTTLGAIDTLYVFSINDPLPDSVEVGALIWDYTAQATTTQD
jgi:hypothetical protein